MNNEKTLAQLEAEAAEANKAIEALNVKKTEIEKTKRDADQKIKLVAEQKQATEQSILRIGEYGPKLKALACGLNPIVNGWTPNSVWNKYKHGEENKVFVEAAEKKFGHMYYECTVGKKSVLLIARPIRSTGTRYSYSQHYEIAGAVQLRVEGGYKELSQHTYKSFETALTKMEKVLNELVSVEGSAWTAKKMRLKALNDIMDVARAKWPKAEEVDAHYSYVPDLSHRNGNRFKESNIIELTVRIKKNDYDSEKRYRDVELKDGKLTATFVRREEI